MLFLIYILLFTDKKKNFVLIIKPLLNSMPLIFFFFCEGSSFEEGISSGNT